MRSRGVSPSWGLLDPCSTRLTLRAPTGLGDLRSTSRAPGASAAVPARTRYVYDGAGRTTAEIFEVNNAERWRTTTTYGGDRVSVDPPAGAVPTTTVSDARGRRLVNVYDALGRRTQLREGSASGPVRASRMSRGRTG